MNNELNIGTINGLTVENILDKMVEKGIGMYPGATGSGQIDGKLILGETVQFDGMYWIVCHTDYINKKAYLASTLIVQDTHFGSNNKYASSTLKTIAKSFEDNMSEGAKSRMVNTRVEGVTAKIFVASDSQLEGNFSYFNSNERRVCQSQTYWTSSSFGSSVLRYVDTNGDIPNDAYSGYPNESRGFRPFCAVSLT